MDESIKHLKTTTFGGRRFTRKQLVSVQKTVAMFRNLSRKELAQTICEHLQWRTASGTNREVACLRMLEQLESAGVLGLPAKGADYRRPAKPIERSGQAEPGEEVRVDLSQLEPLRLERVVDDADKALWNEYVDRFHYLGYRRPMGCYLRYFIVDRDGRRLGCLLFQQATRALPCRDQWIGWQDQRYRKRLDQVVQNTRFLILPWVRVRNLASRSLSLARNRLADDWHSRWGVRPVLVETFVDESRYDGASYRAGGWTRVGETVRRSNKSVKAVYLLELDAEARAILCHGGSRRPKRPKRPAAAVRCEDRFVELWRDFIHVVAEVAGQYDGRWRKRRRVLNTMLVMLFIFRLVFSKNHQGYQITVNELWAQCRQLEVDLPQPQPPVASSFCTARYKVGAQVFKQLHWRIVERLDARHPQSASWREWCGRRLLAVDGTKMNLPRELIQEGYRLAGNNYYPQGLVSCLYRLGDRIPLDFELLSSNNEREAAQMHLRAARAEDVVVYDRGYYSFELLRQHVLRGIDCIFRLQRNSAGQFEEFIASGEAERLIELMPSERSARQWCRDHPGETLHPIPIRLVRYRAGDNDYWLATTLTDAGEFPISQLADAYHGRWGIEELYKVSKRLIEVQQFHGRSEQGVRQELYAHFVLVALARSFGNGLEDHINAEAEDPKWRANFKNVLVTVARNLEALMLGQWQASRTAVSDILSSINACMHKERPGRSYPRISRRPNELFRNASRKASSG